MGDGVQSQATTRGLPQAYYSLIRIDLSKADLLDLAPQITCDMRQVYVCSLQNDKCVIPAWKSIMMSRIPYLARCSLQFENVNSQSRSKPGSRWLSRRVVLTSGVASMGHPSTVGKTLVISLISHLSSNVARLMSSISRYKVQGSL